METSELYNIFKQHPHISTDTRAIAENSIFFALKGTSFDGNNFAAKALEIGANYAVVESESSFVCENQQIKSDKRYIVVEDALEALQQLAALHRQALGIPILAITGSNGKTTTKELVGRVLANRFRIAITKGNLNNHIGVPLTLLSMDKDIEFGIVEMGAGACGEIALLCEIARPNYGHITNIGLAHLEGFGGSEGVIRGKGELYDYLNRHYGLAFYCSDDDRLKGMIAERSEILAKGYKTYEVNEEQSDSLNINYRTGIIHSQLVGDYNRFNLSAAICIGEYFGVAPSEIIETLEEYIPDNNRSQRSIKEHNTLILDCYNANPSSMRAAITNFASEVSPTPKAAILGDMMELGEYSAFEHEAVISLLIDSAIEEVYLVGNNFCEALNRSTNTLPATYIAFEDRKHVIEHLNQHPIRNKLILIKGSRAIGLEKCVEVL